jgi:hypothetical protein
MHTQQQQLLKLAVAAALTVSGNAMMSATAGEPSASTACSSSSSSATWLWHMPLLRCWADQCEQFAGEGALHGALQLSASRLQLMCHQVQALVAGAAQAASLAAAGTARV